MKLHWLFLAVFCSVAFVSVDAQSFVEKGPRKEYLVEKRFGITLTDPYRWMESRDDPELWAFVEKENQKIASYVKGSLYDELYQEMRAVFQPNVRATALPDFWMNKIEQEQMKFRKHKYPFYSTYSETKEALLSPSDNYEVEIISESKSDLRRIEIIDKATGLRLKDVLMAIIPQIYWEPGEKSFIYSTSRDGRLNNVTDAIFRHVLGTPQSEDICLYQSSLHGEYIYLFQSEDFFFIIKQYKDQYSIDRFDITTGQTSPLLLKAPGTLDLITAEKNILYMVSFRDAPMGKIISFDCTTGEMRDIFPEQNLPIHSALKIGDYWYISLIENTASKLISFEQKSGKIKQIILPFVCQATLDQFEDKLTVIAQSYSQKPAVYLYDEDSNELKTLVEPEPLPIQLESFRIYYKAHNGKRVPIWIVKRPDVKLNPETPVFLYGYGGFAISILPSFEPTFVSWYKRGGVCAFVTLPGGTEYGEQWHKEGMVFNKINVFNDFAAAARHLIHKKYTSAHRLVCQGASNGGLLVGMTINLYPELFRVAVPEVGVMDMDRFALFTCGIGWVNEYGDRNNQSEFRNLLKISPYHTIGSHAYPSVLVTTANCDDIVVPLHSFKYTARLQAMNKGNNPVFMLTRNWGSHARKSGPIEEQIKSYATKFTFIMKELDMQ